MKIKIVATTDTGYERTNNEDAFNAATKKRLADAILAKKDLRSDEVLCKHADWVEQFLPKYASVTKDNIEKAIKDDEIDGLFYSSIKDADEAIKKKILEDPDTIGMGTTIVVCWVMDGIAHIAWCGDSRCYIYNAFKGLIPLTKDHSLVQELIDKGEITEEEAFTHPDNNVITRGLGEVDSQPQPDIVSYSICANDILLVCSDGLCGYCTNKEIERVLDKDNIDIMKCRDELMKLALNAGGYDNICIALASLIGDNQSVPQIPSTIQKFFIWFKRSKHST